LWNAKNVVVTKGGDIENAKRWVSTYTLPAGTYGLAQIKSQLFAFGSANLAASMPVGVQYQRLQKDSAVMTRVLDAKIFSGALYVIARFDDGCTYHFYNGTRVTDWDTIADANATYSVLAEYMADEINNESIVDAVPFGSKITLTARTAGTAFTISKSTVNNGGAADQDITLTQIVANVPATAETRATATITVTGGTEADFHEIVQITVNSVELLLDTVRWRTSNTATATALADAINNATTEHGYDAAAIGAVVTISAEPGLGDSPNGHVLAATLRGDVTVSMINVGGGVDAVAAVAQVYTAEFIGTMEAQDQFTITINAMPFISTPRGAATGTSAYVAKKRVYSTAANLMRYCKLNDATNWTDGTVSTGAGFIGVDSDSEGFDRLTGAGAYNLQSAFFSRSSIKMYSLFADTDLIDDDQPIHNSGTGSPRTIITYGNNDLFYLDQSGIRTIRPRYGTDSPYVGDIGSPIDSFIIDFMVSLPQRDIAKAVATIEPRDGRLFVAIKGKVFVLSYYPSNKITAWTYFEPGFEISDFARTGLKLYARSSNTIYLYGGVDGETWPVEGDAIVETVETPFLSAKSAATKKSNRGFDADMFGVWDVDILPDPNNETIMFDAGRVSSNTFSKGDIPVSGTGISQWAFKFSRDSRAGRATISAYAMHYDPNEAK
jgi:hypothetical protein